MKEVVILGRGLSAKSVREIVSGSRLYVLNQRLTTEDSRLCSDPQKVVAILQKLLYNRIITYSGDI